MNIQCAYLTKEIAGVICETKHRIKSAHDRKLSEPGTKPKNYYVTQQDFLS